MSPKPLIGVTPLYDYNLSSWWMVPGYMEGILAAGGIPVMMPFTDDSEVIEQEAERLDGAVITGGPDVDPSYYGETPLLRCGLLAPKRDVNEFAAAKALIAHDKPILGICRGMQLINTLCGGSLYQDLESQHPTLTLHDQKEPNYIPSHKIDIIPGTPLAEWLSGMTELEINSFHHQAVKVLGEGLEPMAFSQNEDLIEAFYAPAKKFCCGVQWHPELLHKSSVRKYHDEQLSVFRALINACK